MSKREGEGESEREREKTGDSDWQKDERSVKFSTE